MIGAIAETATEPIGQSVIHLGLDPVPEHGVGRGGELVPLLELDVELPLPRAAARRLPCVHAEQVPEHVRVEDGAAQADDALDERVVGVVEGADHVGAQPAAAHYGVRLEALGQARGRLEVTPAGQRGVF